jgi:GT2 family glycosyltransferase
MARVGVVVPVRNRAVMVREAIASVLAQTHRDYALVVVDDGSDDDTARAVEEALAPAAVPAAILRCPARGVAAARNAGAAAVDGEWIAFLDSDDLWLPGKLERQMAWLDARPGYRLAQSEERWIERGRHRNPRRRHRKEERLFLRSLARCLVSPSAVVIRRDLYTEAGGFDEAFPICEDYELWLRLTRCEDVGLVPETLVVKRGGHADQLSRSTWGLDRYRVAALVSLLARAPLTAAERAAVVATIDGKCAVLAKGAERRARREEAERYRCLAAAARQLGAPDGHAPAADGCVLSAATGTATSRPGWPADAGVHVPDGAGGVGFPSRPTRVTPPLAARAGRGD